MHNYIRFEDDIPILEQLPKGYQSAAFLLHPLVQMPKGWTKNKKLKEDDQHIYPSPDEIVKLGTPVSWEQVEKYCNASSFKDVSLMLKTCNGSLYEQYQRHDLVNKFIKNDNEDLFLPTEDHISSFLIPKILEVLKINGATSLLYSDPVYDNEGLLEIDKQTTTSIDELVSSEILLMDETDTNIFMSVYDSFTTLYLSKQKDIEKIINEIGWETIVCDKETTIHWFVDQGRTH